MKATLVSLSILLCLGIALPLAGASAADLAKGKELYGKLCGACHGPYGRGDGPVAGDLATRPPDLTNAALLAGRSDDDIVANLVRGGEESHTPMVMARVLKEDALRDALAYMRTLSVPGEHVSVLAGRDLYNSFCWICHGTNGNGNGPAAANIPGTKPRDFTANDFVIEGREDEIYQVISTGAASSIHGSEYMLEWGTKLQPQQMRDVLEYLKTFKNPQP
jgi:mono/diheme cytochrome c family protein